MATFQKLVPSTLIISGALLLAQPGRAEPPAEHPAPGAHPVAATPTTAEGQKMEEARNRYKRGVQYYDENNFEAARVEFERAYQLAPTFKILYNIGFCYGQLGDYVQAQSTLRRFLELGGSEVSGERRAEVEKELTQLSSRVASARITLNVEGAELFVDDVCAVDRQTGITACGETPGRSREVSLNPGRRRITVKKSGYLPETQVVTAAGSDHFDLSITLKALPKPAESNPYLIPTILGWSVTAAGGIATAITGLLASSAADDWTAAVNRFGVSRDELSEAKDKTDTLATASDVLLIGTGVAAAASTYFTVRALGWKRSGAEAQPLVGLGTVGLRGSF